MGGWVNGFERNRIRVQILVASTILTVIEGEGGEPTMKIERDKKSILREVLMEKEGRGRRRGFVSLCFFFLGFSGVLTCLTSIFFDSIHGKGLTIKIFHVSIFRLT